MTEPRNAEFVSEYEQPPRRRWWHRFRSAKTGQLVTEQYADDHPSTTVAEKVERKPEPPPGTGFR